jgi:cell wall-associated NlpC family hydrolase
MAPTDPVAIEAPAGQSEAALIALSLVGTRYAAGGGSPETGFDCSGLVAYVFARSMQLRLPRNTFDLARAGAAVGRGDLRPGDLVFYNTQRRAYSHVGIYLGESRFVHAPSTGGAVRIEEMDLRYWTQRFDGARRVSF